MSDNHTSEKALLGLKMAQQYLGEKLLTALRKDTRSDLFTKTLEEYTAEVTLSSYARPGLSFRERNLMNIAMFVALNRPHELRINLQSAVHNGLSKEQICEAIRHATLYCGMAAGRDAFLLASEVFGVSKIEAN